MQLQAAADEAERDMHTHRRSAERAEQLAGERQLGVGGCCGWQFGQVLMVVLDGFSDCMV